MRGDEVTIEARGARVNCRGAVEERSEEPHETEELNYQRHLKQLAMTNLSL